ncbi:MAG TPA: thiamine phosphate synthase [Clostridia bacterium]|nr:thiamine phosphate synthase [Clostridia bacterium]
MLLYYITDRTQFPGSEAKRREQLLDKIAEAANCGVNYIQLREKDLPIREFEQLARRAVDIVQRANATRSAVQPLPATALLINSRIDIALAVGADGVHLTSTDIAASEARAIWPKSATPGRNPVVGVSCHTATEVSRAAAHGADFAVFAPVFGKVQTGASGVGLSALREAVGVISKPDRRVEAGDNRVTIPVLALGGVTADNAQACLAAGAAGIAGIRLFQQGNISDIRSL